MALWDNGQAWQAGGQNLFRHKDAYYFLPNEDEWYKAAYHKNDGATANYWNYPTGSNSIPDGIDFSADTVFDAVFNQGFNQGGPNSVTNVGGMNPYGTLGMGGNVAEWVESAFDGFNNSSSESRVFRGGDWLNSDAQLRAQFRYSGGTTDTYVNVGFRVASVANVPEPQTVTLLLSGGSVGLLGKRRRRRAKSGDFPTAVGPNVGFAGREGG